MSSTLSRIGPRIAAAIAAMTALALLATAPAQAKYDTSAMCTATFPVVSITTPFRPFVLISRSGTVSSSGQTGTVNCRGT